MTTLKWKTSRDRDEWTCWVDDGWQWHTHQTSCWPAPFAMYVGDAFVIKDRGTVVTGVIECGTPRLGDRLLLGGLEVQCRGIESHLIPRAPRAPDAIGVLVGDVPVESVKAGMWLHDPLYPTTLSPLR